MYTAYAYIQFRYLRRAITPNGQSLVYVNVIQKWSSGIRARLRFLNNRRWLKTKDFCKIICNNIFTNFAKSLLLSFTKMHGETVGGVSCFVQQMHTNIVRTL